MIHSVTAVILAGGKSTRMGTDKAFLPFRGKHLIDTPIEILTSIFSNVILSVRDPNDYSGYALPKVADLYESIGPMGGICSVLKSGYSQVFCVACDMPYLNAPLITHLCNDPGYDAVIPVFRGREEVLHAIYSDRLIPHFEEAIRSKRYKITDALISARVQLISEDEIRRFDPDGRSFQNVNTPADYEKL